MGPEKASIRPEKARFSGKDFCSIFSENLGLKALFLRPPHSSQTQRIWIGQLFMDRAHAKGVVLSKKPLPSECLLESTFLEPLVRALLRTLPPFKAHRKTPSKSPSEDLLEISLEHPS